MTKVEFKKRMFKTKELLINGHNYQKYCCNALHEVFTDSFHISDSQRDRTPVVKLYGDIFTTNDSNFGLYGRASIKENNEKRLLSLEIFEKIVLEEKLYKTL